VLSCWDGVLVFGTLPKISYAGGMTSYLYERKVRIFDCPKFAVPFRDQLRENAERVAAEAGIEIEFLRKRNVRKEDRVREALAGRGEHPGLVCVLSAMELCSTYKSWHDKQTGRTLLKPDDGKCLHYYFYFIDEELGLCYVRVGDTYHPSQGAPGIITQNNLSVATSLRWVCLRFKTASCCRKAGVSKSRSRRE
jgi:hypothetical protein